MTYENDWPEPSRAWYVVALMAVLYAFAYLDRNILALLAQPISAALGISDTKLGLLYGLGFGLLYALAGIPVGRWIDRGHRIWITAAGVATWSACTIASAAASGFATFLILRCGVAIGEAVIAPAAASMIGDLFAPSRRTFASTCFSSVAIVMGSGSFILGSAAFDIANHFRPGPDAWRLALVLAGAPGIILAILMLLTIREPKRRGEPSGQIEELTPTVAETLKYLRQEWRLYVVIYMAIGASAMALYGFLAWLPTLLVRGYGFQITSAGYAAGVIGTIAGIAGVVLWALLAAAQIRRERIDRHGLLAAIGIGTMTVSVVVAGLAKSSFVVLAASAACSFGAAVLTVIPALVPQFIGPPRMRGILMALNTLLGTIIGLGMGPPLVAALAEHYFAGPRALGLGAATVAAGAGLIAVCLFASTTAGYRRAMARSSMPSARNRPQVPHQLKLSEESP